MTDEELKDKVLGRSQRRLKKLLEWKQSPSGKDSAKRSAAWRQTEEGKDSLRKSRLWYLYRITPEQYTTVLKFQGGTCAGCGRLPGKARLAVDHCHATGVIRGLLCWSCNKGLAFYDDDADLLTTLAGYLRNPPATQALGLTVYGLLGKAQRKKKMVYGGPQ